MLLSCCCEEEDMGCAHHNPAASISWTMHVSGCCWPRPVINWSHQCSETALTGKSRFQGVCTPGARTTAPCGRKQIIDPLGQCSSVVLNCSTYTIFKYTFRDKYLATIFCILQFTEPKNTLPAHSRLCWNLLNSTYPVGSLVSHSACPNLVHILVFKFWEKNIPLSVICLRRYSICCVAF
jgi:hypothetical protein